MIRVNQIRLEAGKDQTALLKKVSHIINVPSDKITDFKILKKSVDARKKDQVREIYSCTMNVPDEQFTVKRCASKDVLIYHDEKYLFSVTGTKKSVRRPVVAGFGPSGIFLSYMLALKGFAPIVVERGYDVLTRTNAVNKFFSSGILDPNCNVQFGEGGAGTFSDGKLNTLVKDESGRNRFILETFVRFGAPENILTDARPHIGTDKLMEIIPAIRREIERLGGEIRFGSELTDIETEGSHIKSVTVNSSEKTDTDALFLCLGHSARNTITMLCRKGLVMEAKPFAVGVRVEHLRSMIDGALGIEKSPYKVTHKCADGRGVYSFCMCPGGYVINSSSEEKHLCVNGMSYSKRDGINSDSAIVVTVTPDDYGTDISDPLRGIAFQRNIEEKAYSECSGAVPYQRFEDFCSSRRSDAFGKILPQCKGSFDHGNIRNILPEYICNDICEGITAFNDQIIGFSDPDTLLAGVESRTSSPVRIIRGEDMQCSVKGIYPVGEGAGYAGGIMSAAIDGLKCAESFGKEYTV